MWYLKNKVDMQLTVKALQCVLAKTPTTQMLTPRISTVKMSTAAKLEHIKKTLTYNKCLAVSSLQ